MSEKLQVVITGSNGVSRVFTEVTRDAQRMGTAVETASKVGSESFEKWSNAAQKTGAALGALTAASILISGQAEASQARLETAFANANIVLDDYADTIDRIQAEGLDLGFDDEDVADSVARLVGVTQDADKAFRDLQIAQDIAAGTGKTLAEATAIVAQAEAGRFRGLAQLGIVLDENATKEDYLAAVQAKYAGASERWSRTGAADFARWQNTAENALESVGAKLSAVQGPLIALSASSTLLGTVGGLMKDVGATGAIASVALGPVGLAGAALAAGAGVTYLITQLGRYEDAAEAADGATVSLTNFFTSLAATLDPVRAQIVMDINELVNDLIADAAQRQSDLDKLLSVQAGITLQGISLLDESARAAAEESTALTAAQLEWIDTNDDLVVSIDEVNAAVAMYQVNLDRLDAEQVKAVQEAITSLFSRPNLKYREAADDIAAWAAELEAGTITGEEFTRRVVEASIHYSEYINVVGEATAATGELTAAQVALTAQMDIATGAVDTQARELSALLTPKNVIAAAEQAIALGFVADAMVRTAEESTEAANPITDVSDALQRQVDRAAAAEDAVRGYAEALGEIPAIADTNAARLGANASAAGAALGDAFRVAVGNTDAIGNQSGQVAKWAEELINVSGEYGKIDDLLKSGAISLETYNAAQEAGNRIFDANARIQEDILAIQAQQAPILADLTDEQARYLDHLATLPAEQQAVRLAYMDTATAAKAQEAAALAAAAANGELGEAGEETATKLIQGAADADPYLKMLLEDMGLISVGADGTITVNFGSVEDAGASIDDLYTVLKDLRDILAEAFDVNVTTNAGSTRAELESIVGLLNGLDGRSVTYFVNASGDGVSVGSPTGVGITQGTGGVIPAANGYAGDILVGEFGPELLRRNGGGALVLPTGATQSRMAISGAPNVTININGVGKSTEEIVGELVPAIQLAFEQYYSGHGVR